MNPVLRNFYTNISEREAVQAFLIETLAEMAVEKTFAGEPVTGIKDAKDMVYKAFDRLEKAYGKPPQPVNITPR